MIRKAAIVGASGYVGRRLLADLGSRAIGTYASHALPGLIPFDIGRDKLDALITSAGSDLTHIFLAGAIASPDLCFRQPAETRVVNVTGAIRLMDEALRAGITPVFLSTDYVFRGDAGGYVETDATSPTTRYGAHKAEVEAWITKVGRPSLIARLSKVVGPESGTHSVLGQWAADIRAGKPLRCATDQIFSPMFVGDISHALIDLCDARQSGIWHVAGATPVSRYALADALVQEIRRVSPTTPIDLSPCLLSDIPFAEPRPLNTSLNVGRLSAFLSWKPQTLHQLCAETARAHFG